MVAASSHHDAAFDRGLITVNRGLEVHCVPPLVASSATTPGVSDHSSEALRPTLLVPDGAHAPGGDC